MVQSAEGFSLIEVMVATIMLTVGVLSLVGVMTLGVQTAAGSSSLLVAREKAREAIESVHSARNTGELPWDKVRNVPDGAFLSGMRDVKAPGADGLVNTGDDGAPELGDPGPDGVVGTADDIAAFQRQIDITPLNFDGTVIVNPNLRQITVTIRYRVLGGWRTYSLTTFVSSYA
jgi:type II secretory pathway pseudopilin PulG